MWLDQALTAAIIAAMAATGRWLDDYAAGHAEREMSSLLAKAPRHANRLKAGSNSACHWMQYSRVTACW
jgi:cation transport ATPase